MKALTGVAVALVLLVCVVINNQQHVHLESVSQDQFCMYMGAVDDVNSNGNLRVGLVACFKGNPHDVNEADEVLTEKVMKEKPLMVVSL